LVGVIGQRRHEYLEPTILVDNHAFE
jgi:hypothetical protein